MVRWGGGVQGRVRVGLGFGSLGPSRVTSRVRARIAKGLYLRLDLGLRRGLRRGLRLRLDLGLDLGLGLGSHGPIVSKYSSSRALVARYQSPDDTLINKVNKINK